MFSKFKKWNLNVTVNDNMKVKLNMINIEDDSLILNILKKSLIQVHVIPFHKKCAKWRTNHAEKKSYEIAKKLQLSKCKENNITPFHVTSI